MQADRSTTHYTLTDRTPTLNNCPFVLNCIVQLAATVPELLCGDTAVQEPSQILNFLRKQVRVDAKAARWPSPGHSGLKATQQNHLIGCYICDVSLFQRFNADYELSARQGADTMAYIALLEEKLRPALVAPSLSCLISD